MAARSRTKSLSTTNGFQAFNRIRTKRPKSEDLSDMDDEKENHSSHLAKRKTLSKLARNNSKGKAERVYCLCRQPDDGSPMVYCSQCKDWYHFRCVNLDEVDADDIRIYVCPNCTGKTGRRTVMTWDGEEAVEEHGEAEPSSARRKTSISLQIDDVELSEESDGDPSSEDEYIADPAERKQRKGTSTANSKRRTRRLSLSSESDSQSVGAASNRGASRNSKSNSAHKVSVSPAPSHQKRKSQSTTQLPPPKRKKSDDEDPTRKYCLGKMEEMFQEIFLRYPYGSEGSTLTGETSREGIKVEDNAGQVSDEFRERREGMAKSFAAELEQCMFDIYCEPDKQGKPHASGKYKERFRMFTFNLSKPDRVVIHKRIASSSITPKELSVMSSTDLANEETKQSIKLMEKEALEHSILHKTLVPRAKITHKGLQDIEDVNGELVGLREREKEREREQGERRERERMERLKAAEAHHQQRALSASTQAQGSVPPELPIVQQNTSWGGPPLLPTHREQLSHPGAEGRSPINPLFVGSASDMHASPEPELNLADLINIDEEPLGQDVVVSENNSMPPLTSPQILEDSPPVDSASDFVPTSLSPTASQATANVQIGISPFAVNASRPETTNRPSFDLNTLWNAPKSDVSVASAPRPPSQETESKESLLDMDIIGEEADDRDFDMFLEKDAGEESSAGVQAATVSEEESFLASPAVWTGKITMPLDSSIPQETTVVARQMGGRSLGDVSLLWKTLFPSDTLRIDGRVPVDKSSQFLLQMRMTSSKELIAVAFSPTSDDGRMKAFSDFLIGKSRHGLVFPWGHRPPEHCPGKELYMVPLLATEPLPDYMELLDELHLPKIRNSDYMVGIWVLMKGKLAPPLAFPAPSTSSAPPLPPTISHAVPPILSSSPFPPTTMPPLITPAMPPFSPTNPPPILPSAAPTVGQPPILPSALISEVASLTPEQIQMMLRSLSTNAALPVNLTQPLAVPPAQSPLAQPPIPPPSWASPLRTLNPPFPPVPATIMGQAYPNPSRPPPPSRNPYDQGSFDRHDHDRDQRRAADHERGGRSGGRRSRARARGRASDGPLKPVDSGWPRRPRGPGGEESAGSSRWDEPPAGWNS